MAIPNIAPATGWGLDTATGARTSVRSSFRIFREFRDVRCRFCVPGLLRTEVRAPSIAYSAAHGRAENHLALEACAPFSAGGVGAKTFRVNPSAVALPP